MGILELGFHHAEPRSCAMIFEPYLERWELVPEGIPFKTSVPEGIPFKTKTSWLLPVRQHDVAAMLKIAFHVEEQRGGHLMVWFGGKGAARVLAQDDDTLLLERGNASMSLAELSRRGRDGEASRILCQTIAHLHTPRPNPPPDLVPLQRWFVELWPAAARYGGIMDLSATTARMLLTHQQEVVPLHGDIHHDNVLNFGDRGWLAIDPKGLIGDRCFDYANIFCNPDHATATAPDRFADRLDIVAATAGLERRRLLQWILAWAGLSAAWFLKDRDCAKMPLAIAELAADELKRYGA